MVVVFESCYFAIELRKTIDRYIKQSDERNLDKPPKLVNSKGHFERLLPNRKRAYIIHPQSDQLDEDLNSHVGYSDVP